MRRGPYFNLGIAAALIAGIADQASKYWILNGLDLASLPGRNLDVLPNLSFTLSANHGVTFGVLNDETGARYHLVLAAIAFAVVTVLLLWLRRVETRVTAIALGAIAGGALGNVLDRIRLGGVVDFLHFHVGDWSWYIFNVADSFIVCGVIALVLDGLRPQRSLEGPVS